MDFMTMINPKIEQPLFLQVGDGMDYVHFEFDTYEHGESAFCIVNQEGGYMVLTVDPKNSLLGKDRILLNADARVSAQELIRVGLIQESPVGNKRRHMLYELTPEAIRIRDEQLKNRKPNPYKASPDLSYEERMFYHVG